jgi:hypothetical protein
VAAAAGASGVAAAGLRELLEACALVLIAAVQAEAMVRGFYEAAVTNTSDNSWNLVFTNSRASMSDLTELMDNGR